MSRDIEQAAKDVAAALADLRGRRDQAVAELDERIVQIEKVSEALERGEVEPRVAQERVRRLSSDRRPGMGQPVHAGRTQIGMRMGSEVTPVAAMPSAQRPSGPTPTLAVASVNKAVATLDGRLVAVLSQPASGSARSLARLELGLLRRLRRTLLEQLAGLPEDVVLVGTVIEFAEEAVNVVGDLEGADSVGRARRLLDYVRELLSQLVAAGGAPAGVKEQIQKARALLAQPDKVAAAIQEAAALHDRLSPELSRRYPLDGPATLIDELSR